MSARALGAMVRGMGEESFEDLLPWLMETLTSENSSVDRSGAAQGRHTTYFASRATHAHIQRAFCNYLNKKKRATEIYYPTLKGGSVLTRKRRLKAELDFPDL